MVHLGGLVVDLVFLVSRIGMVFAGLELRQGCAARGHDTVVGSRPITVKPMREMRAQPVELQRLAQDRFDRPVEPQMPHPAAPKLAVHNSVLIFVPLALPKAFPVENHRLKVIRRGADQLGDCLVFVQHQKFIHIADAAPNRAAAVIGCLMTLRSVDRCGGCPSRGLCGTWVSQPAVCERVQQIGRVVGAVIGCDQNVEAQHPIPTDPFHNEWPFIAHTCRDKKSSDLCHTVRQSRKASGVYPQPLLPMMHDANFRQYARRGLYDGLDGGFHNQRHLPEGVVVGYSAGANVVCARRWDGDCLLLISYFMGQLRLGYSAGIGC